MPEIHALSESDLERLNDRVRHALMYLREAQRALLEAARIAGGGEMR
jgi:hypothetical protein